MAKQQLPGRRREQLLPLEVFVFVNAFAVAAGSNVTGTFSTLLHAASQALAKFSRHKDGLNATPSVPRSLFPAPGAHLLDEPRVLQDFSDHYILWKPPFWTVSVNASDAEVAQDPYGPVDREADAVQSGVAVGRQIDKWVTEKLCPRMPIAADRRYACGFIHRLDHQTSGILLVAKSYWGYYWGKLQWAALRVTKQYVALVHGWVPTDVKCLRAPLSPTLRPQVPQSQRPALGGWKSIVKGEGKWALTELRGIAHCEDSRLEPFSLVEIDLHTGRMHQIRAHLSHEGHPLVSDEKYGGSLVDWCPRIFLHASHLHIQDEVQPISAHCSLPGDLRKVLSGLLPRDSSSQKLLNKWLDDA